MSPRAAGSRRARRGEQVQVRPLPIGGDFAAFWRQSGARVAKLGLRGGFVHPVTGRDHRRRRRAPPCCSPPARFLRRRRCTICSRPRPSRSWKKRELLRSVAAALAARQARGGARLARPALRPRARHDRPPPRRPARPDRPDARPAGAKAQLSGPRRRPRNAVHRAIQSGSCDIVTSILAEEDAMRIVGLLSMTALILTGLPPSPIAEVSASAQAREAAHRAPARPDDPDARCAPFLQGGGDYAATAQAMARAGRGHAGSGHRRPRPRLRRQSPPRHRRRRRRRRRARQRGRQRRRHGRAHPAAEHHDRSRRSPPSARARACRAALSTAVARESRALCGRGGRRGPGGRRRAGLDLLDRRRHRLLRQRPPDAERGRDAAAGRGPHRGDAQLFPLRLSGAARPLAAVQRHRPT